MKRKTLGLVSILLLFIGAVIISSEIHKTVAIVVNDQIHTESLWGFIVSDAIVEAGIPIYEGDQIQPELNERLHENELYFYLQQPG